MYKDNIRHNESDNSRAISDAARKLKDDRIRVLDLDQFGYCKKCLQVIYVTEATSARSDKSTLMVRHLAKQLKAVAIFIRHEWEDIDHKYPIYLAAWKPDGSKWQPVDHLVQRTEWESYTKLIKSCQRVHEELTKCSTKPAPYHKEAYPDAWVNSADYSGAEDLSRLR